VRVRQLIPLLSLIPFTAVVPRPIPRPAAQAYLFQHDGVLGTSLDLTFVTSSPRDAQEAERVALAEIERLRRVISTWDSTSEVSRLVASGSTTTASADLLAVLKAYGTWHERSGHAYSARVGSLVKTWRDAQRDGHLPDAGELAAIVRDVQSPAWTIDGARVTMLTHAPVDLNSLGKGYIIDRVVQLVRAKLPSVQGGLVNIGGDIRSWGNPARGDSAWRVAITDPRRHADNAAPLTLLHVADRAVSSSGNYERGFDIAGKHWSHIIDPRNGYPVDHHIGVTVVARDNATANALATTLSVLSAAEGMKLVAATPGTEAMIVTTAGVMVRSPGFAAYERSAPAAAPVVPAAFQATISFDATPTEPNRHRPYVAMWITDTSGLHHVRTLAFWGSKPKYQREMSKWWGLFGTDNTLVDAVTRATRAVGKYTLEWDGLNQAGAAAPAGLYRFWLESAYEDGPHSVKSVIVNCGGAKATGVIDKGAAFGGGEVTCGPGGQ